MKSEDEKIKRAVTIRFKQRDYDKLLSASKTTTKRHLSEYIRDLALKKPVTFYTRNQSLDELMHEFIELRNELSTIGRNFTRLIDRLLTPEGNEDPGTWLRLNEKHKEDFFKKLEEINLKIAQMATLWFQE